MKKVIRWIIVIVITLLVITVLVLLRYNKSLRNDISTYDNNFKALALENQKLEDEAIAYKFSIEQLEYLNDSIINDLNNTRRELKIKDDKILQMQKIKTEIITKDSIYFKDTIFRDNFIKLDTIIKDQWHTLAVQLEPNKLSIQAKYTSNLNVFAYSSKEIIGTPKKCFIGRWFQKKHKVIRVDVKDSNPYSEIKSKKFVIIE
jgi:hypothetical protein